LAGPNPDDQFGGPFADAAHTAGVILRVEEDGAVPTDNPFVGKVSPSFDKVWQYGVRNSFGMAFDPVSGYLWTQENGDNSFDEVNRIEKGMNGGWIQTMGPIGRVQQFHDIEVTVNGLQQVRWPAFRLATVPSLAYRRMFHVPGSRYKDPLMSWKFPVAPAGIGFVHTSALGPDFADTLIMGAARENMLGGYLMRFSLTPDRKDLSLSDPSLADRVADNAARFDPKESESLIVGTDFGVGTDVQISPDGRVYVVSLSHGNVYEIKKK